MKIAKRRRWALSCARCWKCWKCAIALASHRATRSSFNLQKRVSVCVCLFVCVTQKINKMMKSSFISFIFLLVKDGLKSKFSSFSLLFYLFIFKNKHIFYLNRCFWCWINVHASWLSWWRFAGRLLRRQHWRSSFRCSICIERYFRWIFDFLFVFFLFFFF